MADNTSHGARTPELPDLPDDLAAQLEAADPVTCRDLRELARLLDRPAVVLILEALGDFELLTIYHAAFNQGRGCPF